MRLVWRSCHEGGSCVKFYVEVVVVLGLGCEVVAVWWVVLQWRLRRSIHVDGGFRWLWHRLRCVVWAISSWPAGPSGGPLVAVSRSCPSRTRSIGGATVYRPGWGGRGALMTRDCGREEDLATRRRPGGIKPPESIPKVSRFFTVADSIYASVLPQVLMDSACKW